MTSRNLLKKKIAHCTFKCQHIHVLKAKIIELKNWICRISNVDHGQIVSSQFWLEMVPLLLSFQATTAQACCEVAPKIANVKRNKESTHGVCSSMENLLENGTEK